MFSFDLNLLSALLRTFTAVVLIITAALSVLLLFTYRGMRLDKPWLPILLGLTLLGVMQAISAYGYAINSDYIRLLAGIVGFIAALFILVGIYGTYRVWKHALGIRHLTANDSKQA
jgi:hypothetical protein